MGGKCVIFVASWNSWMFFSKVSWSGVMFQYIFKNLSKLFHNPLWEENGQSFLASSFNGICLITEYFLHHKGEHYENECNVSNHVLYVHPKKIPILVPTSKSFFVRVKNMVDAKKKHWQSVACHQELNKTNQNSVKIMFNATSARSTKRYTNEFKKQITPDQARIPLHKLRSGQSPSSKTRPNTLFLWNRKRFNLYLCLNFWASQKWEQ